MRQLSLAWQHDIPPEEHEPAHLEIFGSVPVPGRFSERPRLPRTKGAPALSTCFPVTVQDPQKRPCAVELVRTVDGMFQDELARMRQAVNSSSPARPGESSAACPLSGSLPLS